MSVRSTPPGRWFSAPPDKRRALYYRCMREVYGMKAYEALAHTRRMFRIFPANGDVVSAVRDAMFTGSLS